MLAEGSGDLVASLVGISERRQAMVDFTDPLYGHAKAIIVGGPGAPPVSQLDDLAGKEVYYYANTVPYEKLTELNESLEKRGKPPIKLMAADADLRDEDLLEMVNAGLVQLTVASRRKKLGCNSSSITNSLRSCGGGRSGVLGDSKAYTTTRSRGERIHPGAPVRDGVREHGGAKVHERCQVGERGPSEEGLRSFREPGGSLP
jgi:hypothetical protein